MQCHHKGQNDLLITEIKFHEHGSTETKVTAKICLQTDNNDRCSIDVKKYIDKNIGWCLTFVGVNRYL
jgi:hypothetical protein